MAAALGLALAPGTGGPAVVGLAGGTLAGLGAGPALTGVLLCLDSENMEKSKNTTDRAARVICNSI